MTFHYLSQLALKRIYRLRGIEKEHLSYQPNFAKLLFSCHCTLRLDVSWENPYDAKIPFIYALASKVMKSRITGDLFALNRQGSISGLPVDRKTIAHPTV